MKRKKRIEYLRSANDCLLRHCAEIARLCEDAMREIAAMGGEGADHARKVLAEMEKRPDMLRSDLDKITDHYR